MTCRLETSALVKAIVTTITRVHLILSLVVLMIITVAAIKYVLSKVFS